MKKRADYFDGPSANWRIYCSYLAKSLSRVPELSILKKRIINEDQEAIFLMKCRQSFLKQITKKLQGNVSICLFSQKDEIITYEY